MDFLSKKFLYVFCFGGVHIYFVLHLILATYFLFQMKHTLYC